MMTAVEKVRPTREQLLVRLPEINTLTGDVKEHVIGMFIDMVPPYFWLARASESYHTADERGLGGLWLHTKRVYAAYRMMEPTYQALGLLDDFEQNCARAAVLLHDGYKYGGRGMSGGEKRQDDAAHGYADGLLEDLPAHTVRDHDEKMANKIRKWSDLPDDVARIVETHGGSTEWASHAGPSPRNDVELLVHLADMLAADDSSRTPVYEPSRELLQMIGQDVPRVGSDLR